MKFKSFMLALVAVVSLMQNAWAATYYMATAASSPAGSDSNNGASAAPWLTLHHAMTSMSAGDTLIIRDGTYTGSDNTITTATYHPPTSASSWTTIQAENPGSVIFDGEGTRNMWLCQFDGVTDCRWIFDGIVYQNSSATNVAIARCNYVKFLRCGFADAEITNDSFNAQICTYLLLEDCYSWGTARYHYHYYNVDHSIMRRCVARHDKGSASMQVGFQVYNCNTVEVQNCIVIDSDQDAYYGSPGEAWAFKVPQVSTGTIYFKGCIALNNALDGFLAAASGQSSSLSDFIVWKSTRDSGPYSRTSATLSLSHCTLGDIDTYGVQGDGTTKTVTDSILYDCGTAIYNWGGSTTSDYNAYYGNSTADFSGATDGAHDYCAANSNAIDPTAGSLEYLPRIESGSSLEGKASDAGDIGATILYQIGVSGTLYGETGYNTVTATALWPWPYEATIKTKMAAWSATGQSGARGFCTGTSKDGSSQTLTKYIWEYLGNQIPADVYGSSSTPTAVGCTIVRGSLH